MANICRLDSWNMRNFQTILANQLGALIDGSRMPAMESPLQESQVTGYRRPWTFLEARNGEAARQAASLE